MKNLVLILLVVALVAGLTTNAFCQDSQNVGPSGVEAFICNFWADDNANGFIEEEECRGSDWRFGREECLFVGFNIYFLQGEKFSFQIVRKHKIIWGYDMQVSSDKCMSYAMKYPREISDVGGTGHYTIRVLVGEHRKLIYEKKFLLD